MSIYALSRWIAALSVGLLFLAVACGGGSLNTCEGLESWVKDLSEESEGWQPIFKIYEIEELSRTETRVDCTGRAKLQDGSNIHISFYNLIDSDGDYRYGFGVLRTPVAVSIPTTTPRSTPTLIPTPLDPTKEMEEAKEAVQYIIANKHRIAGVGIRNLCNGRYSLDAADKLRTDIAGFEGRLVDRGHRALGAPMESTTYDGWEPDLHRDVRKLASQLEKEATNIVNYCMKS